MPGSLVRNAVAQLCDAVRDEDEVEPTEDCPVLGDEHVVGAFASLLLRQPRAVPLGELFEELIATIGDRSSEVGAIRGLEVQDRRSVVGTQTLQLRHDFERIDALMPVEGPCTAWDRPVLMAAPLSIGPRRTFRSLRVGVSFQLIA